jgi:hypothetical protein
MRFTITASGVEIGTYEGSSEIEALEAYAKEAGYESYDKMVLFCADPDGAFADDDEALGRAIEREEASVKVRRQG